MPGLIKRETRFADFGQFIAQFALASINLSADGKNSESVYRLIS
jgi:hypothetical protein